MNARFKIYFGVAGARARKVALKRVRFDVIAILLIVSLGIGGLIGYVQIRGFETLFEASNQLQKAVSSLAATDTPEPAQSQPVPPPVRRAPDARPVVEPGPVVSEPESPSVTTTSPGGSVVSAATPTFRVQVGAFRLRANAEVLVKQLGRDGFRASIRQTSDLYKVQVGPFHDRKDANRLAKELKAKQYDVFVTQATTSSR
ncbi:MAG: SPOR domain-containing protein [bacterium]